MSYQKAKSLPAKIKNAKKQTAVNKKRRQLFNQANKQYEFSDYSLQDYTLLLRRWNWLADHIDSSTAQSLAKRAYNSVCQYVWGKRGKPRFKSKNSLSSIESKSNASGIRWRKGYIEWSGLTLKVLPDKKDKHGLEVYALSCKTKYVRLVKRIIKGQPVWYTQLVQEGKPYIKAKQSIGKGVVGLDIGSSTIAMVNDTKAELLAFCEEVSIYDKKIKRLQRKVSRSIRATNPYYLPVAQWI